MGDKDFQIEIRQPGHAVTVNFGLYIDGIGMTLRTLPLPTGSVQEHMDWLAATGQMCDHSTPSLWIFQGVFPKGRRPDEVFIHIAINMHDAAAILDNPKLIRLYGARDAAKLVPLDPVTGDARLTVAEFNDWVSATVDGTERQDFSLADDDSWSAFEDMLQQAADENPNNPQEGK